MEIGGDKVSAILWRALVVVLAGGTIGLLYNALSPSGISLRRSASVGRGISTVTLGEAKAKFDGAEAIFVDARPAKRYMAGHIPGALSLPYEDFDARYPEIADWLPLDRQIIVYCIGPKCGLSKLLAETLSHLEYVNVEVFSGGWEAWRGAGYPTEKEIERGQ